jgi:transmembrane sensor
MSCIIEKGDPQDPESVDINEKLGWIKGKLVFKKTPLSEVADELERFYNIQIKITPPELGDKTITATIYELSADQAIKSICQSLQINFKKKGKTYILYNGKKQ